MATQQEKGWWTVPPIWKGGTVYIIGGGPSLLDMDLTPLHDTAHRVIGVNNAFALGPWVDVCYFGDCRWWDRNKDELKDFPGLVVSSCNRKAPWMPRWVKQLKRNHKTIGITHGADSISWNNNSGASAINLAVQLGAKKIVLIGFDMQVKEGAPNKGHNWHDRHERFHTPAENIYAHRFLKSFGVLAQDLEAAGVECVNATPGSKLTVFPMVKLEDVV